ncbi:hypothetical protein FHR50_001969 [Xanthomonas arboricola]
MQRAAILLGIACALACAATRAAPAAAEQAEQAEQRALPTAVADAALEAHYIDPSMAQRMRNALRQHAERGDYAAIAEPAALAQRTICMRSRMTDSRGIAPSHRAPRDVDDSHGRACSGRVCRRAAQGCFNATGSNHRIRGRCCLCIRLLQLA